MGLVLHRFPLSHFSEKARAALDFKGLDYRVVDHAPGPDQLALYRISGQRKVPVLEHDEQVIHDSTAIALHLERAWPAGDGRRALLPADITKRRAVLDLEARLDAVLGAYVPTVVVERSLHDRALFEALARHGLNLRGLTFQATRVAGLAARVAMRLPTSRRPFEEARAAVVHLLTELSDRLSRTAFLLGDEPGLADVAAAGLTLLLKFPQSRHLASPALAGLGDPTLYDAPALRRFFTWREAFYREFLR